MSSKSIGLVLPSFFLLYAVVGVQKYLLDTSTICIILNDSFELNLKSVSTGELRAVINIFRPKLHEEQDYQFVDCGEKRKYLEDVGISLDIFEEILTLSIETSHCETFIVFQEDIPIFVEAFTNASKYSFWRSSRNKYLFIYDKKRMLDNYFDHHFFENQPNILLIERANSSSTVYNLKTNKFVGSRKDHPEQMYFLDRFNGASNSFRYGRNLYPDKTKNLMGREIILGTFDYAPNILLKFDRENNVRDLASNNLNKGAYLDGTEARILMTFCEIYNCTIVVDSSGGAEWGVIYANTSGNGVLGMIADFKVDMALAAMYAWHGAYLSLDMTTFVGRSGITCLVPAPRRVSSWFLPIEPFTPVLWIAIGGCLLLEIFGLLMTRRVEQLESVDGSWRESFAFGFTTTLKLFVSQASNYVVTSTSVRAVLLSCYLIDVIITSVYGGGLASILTLPKLEEAADSVERLHKHQLIWAGTTYAWIFSLIDSDEVKIQEIIANFKVYSEDHLKELYLHGHVGFATERTMFGHFTVPEFITREAADRFKMMDDDIYFQWCVVFVSRLWPFLDRYNDLIYAWHSSGLDKFWEWKIVADFLDIILQKQLAESGNENDVGPLKLDMSNFAGLILIWLGGVAISAVVFTFEMVYGRLWQKTGMV